MKKQGTISELCIHAKRPDNSKFPKLPLNSMSIIKIRHSNVEIQIWNTDFHVIIVPVVIRVLKALFEIQTDVGK